jgi:hypothetical protein
VTRYVYRCKADRRHGSDTCTGGASITAAVAEQHVADWLFDYLSRGPLPSTTPRRSTQRRLTRCECALDGIKHVTSWPSGLLYGPVTAHVDPRVVDAGGVLLLSAVAARWPAVARGRR